MRCYYWHFGREKRNCRALAAIVTLFTIIQVQQLLNYLGGLDTYKLSGTFLNSCSPKLFIHIIVCLHIQFCGNRSWAHDNLPNLLFPVLRPNFSSSNLPSLLSFHHSFLSSFSSFFPSLLPCLSPTSFLPSIIQPSCNTTLVFSCFPSFSPSKLPFYLLSLSLQPFLFTLWTCNLSQVDMHNSTAHLASTVHHCTFLPMVITSRVTWWQMRNQ